MTTKYDDLLELKRDMLKAGYIKQFPMNVLEIFIGRRFGISDYIFKTIMQSLVKFQIIKQSRYGMNLFEWVEPIEESRIIEEEEKTIDKTIDELTDKWEKE